jgi:hypothetical protein
MLYDCLKKMDDGKDVYSLKTKYLFNFIDNIQEYSIKENIEYFLTGNISFALYFKTIFREPKDIDIFIFEKDLQKWKDFFKKNNFIFIKFGENSINGRYAIFKVINYLNLGFNFKIELYIKEISYPIDKIIKIDIDNKTIKIADPLFTINIRNQYREYKTNKLRDKDIEDFKIFKKLLIDKNINNI